MRYTIAEKVEMVIIYGECHRIMRKAVRVYGERFTDRNSPSLSVFANIIKKFRETGNVDKEKRIRAKKATDDGNTINILASVIQNPHVGTRQLERESGISQRSILRILKVNKFHPFHISLHQQLSENDFQKRLQFCEWGLRKLQDDQMFLNKILFTDEATFTNHGQVNCHNMHYWSVDNPRWLREVDKQRPWSVNVWCGLLHNKIIGPYFIDGTLNSHKYERILKDVLPELLEDISLDMRQSMWFQQDGCPAHSARNVTELLNRTFEGRWIGRSGSNKWPARSPDLTPLDFYFWGKLKEQVYREKPTTTVDMQERIKRACSVIDTTEICQAVSSVLQRFRLCLNVQGRHFEHLK